MSFKVTLIIVLFVLSIALLLACDGYDEPAYEPPENESVEQASSEEASEIEEELAHDNIAENSVAADPSRGVFPFSFTATDLYGNAVTELSLGEKEFFFVYIWTTWCPSCIRAMPAMAELKQLYGDRVGFIGLLGDFDTNQSGALSIVESVELSPAFINVDINNPEFFELLSMIDTQFIPTSVVLTPGGTISEPLIGGTFSQYAELIESMFD